MNRRSFLQLLGAGAAGLVLDPELALWKPGAKTIFLPPLRTIEPLSFENYVREAARALADEIDRRGVALFRATGPQMFGIDCDAPLEYRAHDAKLAGRLLGREASRRGLSTLDKPEMPMHVDRAVVVTNGRIALRGVKTYDFDTDRNILRLDAVGNCGTLSTMR